MTSYMFEIQYRYFAAGIVLSVLGLTITTFGMVDAFFTAQLAGTALFAFGSIVVALALLKAELIDQESAGNGE